MQIIKNALRFNLRKCKFTGLHAPDPPRLSIYFACQHVCFAKLGHAFIILNLSPPTCENVPTPLVNGKHYAYRVSQLSEVKIWREIFNEFGKRCTIIFINTVNICHQNIPCHCFINNITRILYLFIAIIHR